MDKIPDCPDGEDEMKELVDECALKKDKCDHDRANCTNIPNGAYACTCIPPYVGDGFTCGMPTTTTPATTVPTTSNLFFTFLSTNAKQCNAIFCKTFTARPRIPCSVLKDPFICPISKICIPKAWVKDKVTDCPDGEDEWPDSTTVASTLTTTGKVHLKVLTTNAHIAVNHHLLHETLSPKDCAM